MHWFVALGGEIGVENSPPDVPFLSSPLLYSNALMISWGAHLQDLMAAGVWSQEERELHINVLEMKVVWLALNAFLSTILGELVIPTAP